MGKDYMKKCLSKYLLICIIFFNILYAQTQDTTQDSLQDSTIVSPVLPKQNTNDGIQDETSLGDLFSPAKVIKNSYGSFMVGYELLYKNSPNMPKTKNEGIYFALDRGWNFIDDILLFGFSLDGTAGSFYAININAKLGTRIFDGRIIPSISLGYGLLNHSINNVQYNLHGASGTIAFFVDIIRGFGLEVGYRMGLHPFYATKKDSTLKVNNINAFIVSFKFMDFNI